MGISTQQLKDYFGHQKTFTKQELQDFYEREKDYTESDLFWAVYDLKRKNVIKSVDENTYKLVDERLRSFEPILSDRLLKVNELINEFDADMKYCIWESNWLNNLSIHQAIHNLIIVELESDAVEFVFYHLHDKLTERVFSYTTKADGVLLDKYIFEAKNPIIIKKIITKAPLKKIQQTPHPIFIPKLEKILVDLFCDNALLIAYKGAEQERIFEKAINKYQINFYTMFSYAKRRNQDTELRKYLYKCFKTELLNIFK